MPVVGVALLAEGVDRNVDSLIPDLTDEQVALLAEGVDRNLSLIVTFSKWREVALLAEGVDRNTKPVCKTLAEFVALLAEGVDRNTTHYAHTQTRKRRPPRGGRG